MRRFLLGAVAASLIIAGPAVAADLPEVVEVMDVVPVRTFSWTGAYVGVNAGYAWGSSDWDINPGADISMNPSGFIGGLQAGYQYQFDNGIVTGVEAGWQWLAANADTKCPNPAFNCKTEANWIADVRAKLGYGMDRFLVYGAGGISFGDIHTQARPNPGGFSKDETAVGWNIGAGVEYAVLDSVILGLEYKYTDLGDVSFKTGGTKVNNDVNFSTVSARVSYKFNGF